MKKKIMIIVSVIVILLIGMFVLLVSDLSGLRDAELQGIDLTTLEDGSYTGTFQHGRFTNTLTVHVENSRIIGIDVEEDIFAAWVTNASDEVFRRVIAMQDTRIDAVTEATVTTNAYLKAIENALRQP